MSDLLPCPFCGGASRLSVAAMINGSDHYAAGCCKCPIATEWQDIEQSAIAAWNTRALPAASPADHSTPPSAHPEARHTEAGAGDGAEAPAHAEPVAWTGSGSLMALKDGREGFIWPSKAEAHPIPLYAHPPTDAAEIERHKHRADNHAETMRGARKWLIEGDADRALLWLNDGLSGYTDTAENTLSESVSRAEKAEAALSESQAREAMAYEAAAQEADEHRHFAKGIECCGDCIRALTPAAAQATLDARINAAKEEGRIAGLREAAKLIDEGFDRGIASKVEKCAHDRNGWEDCESCASAAILARIEAEL